MAEDYCGPLKACANLDGQLLIEQSVQGPSLAVGGDIGIGDLNGRVVVRPYIRFRYTQSWIPKEICSGPIRSVLGLAPSETMTLETRQVEQIDFVRLVQEASERSEIVSTSGPAGLMERGDGSGTGYRPTDFMCFPVMWADRFGSIWETLGEIGGAVVGAVVGGPIGAGVGAWVGGAIGGWLGGDDSGGAGTGNQATQDAVDQVLESVTRTQSERTLTETTTSRSSLFERTVQRTFTNPYRDRALQLRFIPVFRHFDVVTVFYTFEVGLVANVFGPRFVGSALSARLGDFIQRQVPDPRITAVAAAELGAPEPLPVKGKRALAASPLSAHLNANTEFYAKRYLKHLEARRDFMTLQAPLLGALAPRATAGADIGDIGRSLRWSKARVQGRSIYTPFAPADILLKTLPGIPRDFPALFDRLERFRLRRVERHRDVRLFAGTIIEPAPGECKLADVTEQ